MPELVKRATWSTWQELYGEELLSGHCYLVG